jgi:gluconate 2-dehydrogenase gamma chain
MPQSTRRQLLGATALVAVAGPALARSISNQMPWQPGEAYPPPAVEPGPLQFLTADEGAALDAIVDRLIPADDLGPGGKDAGCTIFIDRQLAGPYGSNEWLYTQGPHSQDPLPTQGLQTPLTPREQYRKGLAALADYCWATFGRAFQQLAPVDQDQVLKGLETGEIKLSGFEATMLFAVIHANTMEGFFADPIYGGNRDMVGWKLVGFPGTRYDYRDVMEKPNQPYRLPPVSIKGRPAWDNAAK